MFRALLCSSSGGQNFIIQHLLSSHSVTGRPVHSAHRTAGKLRKETVFKEATCLLLSLFSSLSQRKVPVFPEVFFHAIQFVLQVTTLPLSLTCSV